MIIAVSLILLGYIVLITILFAGWIKSQKLKLSTFPTEAFISVLIPVRNEEKNIVALLQSLSRQDYTRFEVIAVDDHSEDLTVTEISRLNFPFVRVITNAGVGKKQAITTGVNFASGNIIATTDGDCTIPGEWLKSINTYFSDENTVMLIGGVCIKKSKTFFQKLQEIEFASLIGSSASTLALGFPTMCNGANLSYRKEVFHQVNGYEGNLQIASGDDEFLMRKVSMIFPKGIKFLANKNAVVQTLPQPDLPKFIQQRLRWASKWKHNSSIMPMLLAFFIFMIQLSVLCGYVEIIRNHNSIILSLLAIKIFFEMVLLLSFCRFLGVRWNWGAFLTLQIFYPVYVIFIGIRSFFNVYTWKDRNYKS